MRVTDWFAYTNGLSHHVPSALPVAQSTLVAFCSRVKWVRCFLGSVHADYLLTRPDDLDRQKQKPRKMLCGLGSWREQQQDDWGQSKDSSCCTTRPHSTLRGLNWPQRLNATLDALNYTQIFLIASSCAIISVTSGCASHSLTPRGIGVGGHLSQHTKGNGCQTNTNRFFHKYSYLNHSGLRTNNCHILALGTVFHCETAAWLIPSMSARSRCEPARRIRCSFVMPDILHKCA